MVVGKYGGGVCGWVSTPSSDTYVSDTYTPLFIKALITHIHTHTCINTNTHTPVIKAQGRQPLPLSTCCCCCIKTPNSPGYPQVKAFKNTILTYGCGADA